MRALLLGLVVLAGFVGGAAAHETRPAYLAIEETAPGRFHVLWRTPVLSGRPLPVVLKLPEGVRSTAEPVTQRLFDSLLERRTIATDAGDLAGQRVEFVGLQATITDVLVRVQWLDGNQATVIVRPSQPSLALPARQSGWAVAVEYAKLGTEHILLGLDHLLFVLALLILTPGILPLLKTVTAFTVAHSITLGLATLGFVHVPQRPVEAVVALSIVFVAAEIVYARRGGAGITARTPWIVAFVFGLLHGFGFAGALSELGLPPGHVPLALLSFNVGVEVGQLLFIAAAINLAVAVRRVRIPLPRWAGLVPPYVIGGAAMLWVFERVAAL